MCGHFLGRPHFALKIAHSRVGIWTPISYLVPLAHLSPHPKRHLYNSAIFAGLTIVTDRQADRVCSNRPRLRVVLRCSLIITRMWANAQRDGRPAEHTWRPLFNAAKFGSRPILECRAVTLPRRETR